MKTIPVLNQEQEMNEKNNGQTMMSVYLHGCEARKMTDGSNRLEVLVPVRMLQPEEDEMLKNLFPNFHGKARQLLAQEALLDRAELE